MFSSSPFPFVLLLFSSFAFRAADAAAFTKWRRQSVAAPQTLTIPVRLNGGSVYSVGVNMSSNAPQAFHFALSTYTAMTTVAGVSCNSCNGVPSYNPALSTSVQQAANGNNSQQQSISMLGFSASGSLVEEYCTLLQANGSAWVYSNQTVTVANSSTSGIPTGTSGVFGLGQSPFDQSPAKHWLQNNSDQPAFQVGFALNALSNTSSDGGELHWIAADADAYEGDVMWLPMSAIDTATATNTNASWSVEMDGWDAAATGTNAFNVSQKGTPLSAYLDPFYPNIVFPQSAAQAIYANIKGATPLSFPLTSYTNAWSVPCDAEFTLSVTFGTFTTSLDQASLVVVLQDGLCVGALQEWNEAGITEYLLGSPFIASIYMIISYAQNGDGTLGMAKRSPVGSDKLSGGTIAGIVLGTFAVIALLVIAAVLLYNAYRQRKYASPAAMWRAAQRKKYKRSKETDVTPFPIGGAQYARYPDGRLGVIAAHGSPNSPRAGLLAVDANGNSSQNTSPDWQTTMFSDVTDTNTFLGGTASRHDRDLYLSYQTDGPVPVPSTRISHAYRGSDDLRLSPGRGGGYTAQPISVSAGNSSTSLLPQAPQIQVDLASQFDSPPPYRGTASPVPLAPLRKGRRPS
uniref:Acid protease n=1 Tax=Mycena chlorophos TaxID=658473 RepID=A0ABQ0LH32_MYCCL|nr:acid protease [Mycena chlorophos]